MSVRPTTTSAPNGVAPIIGYVVSTLSAQQRQTQVEIARKFLMHLRRVQHKFEGTEPLWRDMALQADMYRGFLAACSLAHNVPRALVSRTLDDAMGFILGLQHLHMSIYDVINKPTVLIPHKQAPIIFIGYLFCLEHNAPIEDNDTTGYPKIRCLIDSKFSFYATVTDETREHLEYQQRPPDDTVLPNIFRDNPGLYGFCLAEVAVCRDNWDKDVGTSTLQRWKRNPTTSYNDQLVRQSFYHTPSNWKIMPADELFETAFTSAPNTPDTDSYTVPMDHLELYKTGVRAPPNNHYFQHVQQANILKTAGPLYVFDVEDVQNSDVDIFFTPYLEKLTNPDQPDPSPLRPYNSNFEVLQKPHTKYCTQLYSQPHNAHYFNPRVQPEQFLVQRNQNLIPSKSSQFSPEAIRHCPILRGFDWTDARRVHSEELDDPAIDETTNLQRRQNLLFDFVWLYNDACHGRIEINDQGHTSFVTR